MDIYGDLSKFTDEEINEKVAQLIKIIISPNLNLSMQARPILEIYKEEQSRRMAMVLEKFDKKKKRNKNKDMNIDETIEFGEVEKHNGS